MPTIQHSFQSMHFILQIFSHNPFQIIYNCPRLLHIFIIYLFFRITFVKKTWLTLTRSWRQRRKSLRALHQDDEKLREEYMKLQIIEAKWRDYPPKYDVVREAQGSGETLRGSTHSEGSESSSEAMGRTLMDRNRI